MKSHCKKCVLRSDLKVFIPSRQGNANKNNLIKSVAFVVINSANNLLLLYACTSTLKTKNLMPICRGKDITHAGYLQVTLMHIGALVFIQ